MFINFYIYQALDQFQLKLLTIIDNFPITNSFIYLIIIYFTIRLIFSPISPRIKKLNFINFKLITDINKLKTIKTVKLEILTKNNIILLMIKLYKFVFGLVKQQIIKDSSKYFPIILTLFLFILLANMFGMTLYSFTLTSHVTIAFTLSFSFFIAILIIGLKIQKIKFINTFIPQAKISPILLPFLIIIEIISYFSKPFSLGIRLFANMMSGHTLLIILAGFMILILEKSIYLFILPFILLLAIIGLEIMIALLQTYVFTVLVCIYLNDSISGAH